MKRRIGFLLLLIHPFVARFGVAVEPAYATATTCTGTPLCFTVYGEGSRVHPYVSMNTTNGSWNYGHMQSIGNTGGESLPQQQPGLAQPKPGLPVCGLLGRRVHLRLWPLVALGWIQVGSPVRRLEMHQDPSVAAWCVGGQRRRIAHRCGSEPS